MVCTLLLSVQSGLDAQTDTQPNTGRTGDAGNAKTAPATPERQLTKDDIMRIRRGFVQRVFPQHLHNFDQATSEHKKVELFYMLVGSELQRLTTGSAPSGSRLLPGLMGLLFSQIPFFGSFLEGAFASPPSSGVDELRMAEGSMKAAEYIIRQTLGDSQAVEFPAAPAREKARVFSQSLQSLLRTVEWPTVITVYLSDLPSDLGREFVASKLGPAAVAGNPDAMRGYARKAWSEADVIERSFKIRDALQAVLTNGIELLDSDDPKALDRYMQMTDADKLQLSMRSFVARSLGKAGLKEMEDRERNRQPLGPVHRAGLVTYVNWRIALVGLL